MTGLPNWFAPRIPSFEKHLSHLAGEPDIRVCQIGVYAGHATRWLCDNILTGENSRLYDVDTWEGSDDEGPLEWQRVLGEYAANKRGRRVLSYWMTSDEFFLTLQETVKFHAIYIDGSHHAYQVLKDALHAHDRLLPGGVLAFDDYEWIAPDRGEDVPRTAIDAFIERHGSKYDLLEKNVQVWLRREQG